MNLDVRIEAFPIGGQSELMTCLFFMGRDVHGGDDKQALKSIINGLILSSWEGEVSDVKFDAWFHTENDQFIEFMDSLIDDHRYSVEISPSHFCYVEHDGEQTVKNVCDVRHSIVTRHILDELVDQVS
ncbi:hypothetical protein [Endozoicomonas sp. ALC066]|uniref:hypothetical protein n=1 Tax=Endozoicomonas sp. ALC066 TaxID=3403078 RepID=UPI003BB739AC